MDLAAASVACPAGQVVAIRFAADGSGRADFAEACTSCELRETLHHLGLGALGQRRPKRSGAAAPQGGPSRSRLAGRVPLHRPKVERKIANFVRVSWGGRKARTRGRTRISTDVDTRAAAVNWARLATLGVCMVDGRWAKVPP